MCFRRLHPIYVAVIGALVAFVFARTVLGGSRSALLEVVTFGLISLLVQDGRIRAGSRMLVVGIAVCVMAPYLYFTATYLRNVGWDEQDAVSIDAIMNLEGSEASGVANRDVLFERMFARTGYLDHVTAMMANRDKYSETVGVRYEVESAIDNALTPGFDIFDRAKVALVLGELDRGALDVPRRSAMSRDVYNSEMMTAYGEAHLLFGYGGGLIALFVGACAFKSVYAAYRGRQLFELYIYRSLVMWCFYNWTKSYGMDWLLSEVITVSIFFALFRQYFIWGGRGRKVTRTSGSDVTVTTFRTPLNPLRHQGSV